jgi:hypothetical protein
MVADPKCEIEVRYESQLPTGECDDSFRPHMTPTVCAICESFRVQSRVAPRSIYGASKDWECPRNVPRIPGRKHGRGCCAQASFQSYLRRRSTNSATRNCWSLSQTDTYLSELRGAQTVHESIGQCANGRTESVQQIILKSSS